MGTVVFYDDVTQDEVDRYPTWLLFARRRPRHSTRVISTSTTRSNFALARVSAQVENEFVKAVPPNVTYTLHETSIDESQVNSSVRPEALAFGVFGALVLLSTLLVALQLIARQLRVARDEQATLRALGASRRSIIVDVVSGSLAAIVVGTLVAVVVRSSSRPFRRLARSGPLLGGRYHFNVEVLLPCVGVLLVGSLSGAIVLAVRSAPGRRQASDVPVRRARRSCERPPISAFPRRPSRDCTSRSSLVAVVAPHPFVRCSLGWRWP